MILYRALFAASIRLSAGISVLSVKNFPVEINDSLILIVGFIPLALQNLVTVSRRINANSEERFFASAGNFIIEKIILAQLSSSSSVLAWPALMAYSSLSFFINPICC